MMSQKQIDEMAAIRRDLQTLLQRLDSWMASATLAVTSVQAVSAPPAAAQPTPQTAKAPAGQLPQPATPRPPVAPASLSSRAFHSPYSQVLKGKSDEETKPPEPIAVASGTLTALRDAAEAVLNQSAKPLSFNAIYTKLSELHNALPADKPMLVLRKILSDRSVFSVTANGLYALTMASTPAEHDPALPVNAAEPSPAPQNIVAAAPVAPQSATASDFTNKLNRILGQ